MEYSEAKQAVLKFFEDYLEKYAFEDLKKLREIQSTATNLNGSCAIPQSVTTFAICDLFGFFFDPQAVGDKSPMRIKGFLKESWFSDFHSCYTGNLEELLDFIRDAIRSKKSHRFFTSKVSISKDPSLPGKLLVADNGQLIFNVNYFTDRVSEVINSIKLGIMADGLQIDSEKNNAVLVMRIAERINQLKTSDAKYDTIINTLISENTPLLSPSVAYQTTSSLG